MKQTLSGLEELNIHVNRFRTSACFYEKVTIQYLESYPCKIKHYILAEMNSGLHIDENY